MTKTVFVVYYSMYGHVEKLAREVVKGLEKSGVNAKLYQAAETLPQEVLTKMHAPPKASDVPYLQISDLVNADGILFGLPTRFGMVPAQMKAVFDSCGQLWLSGALYGKFVGTFFSTGSLGAGQETTAMSCLPFFAHMGLIYVPIGYKNQRLTDVKEVHGGRHIFILNFKLTFPSLNSLNIKGSAWGSGTISGSDGSRQPSELEFELAHFQGYEFGSLLKRVSSVEATNGVH
jgi:NAD(P)H dehydrogenase (quinone)